MAISNNQVIFEFIAKSRSFTGETDKARAAIERVSNSTLTLNKANVVIEKSTGRFISQAKAAAAANKAHADQMRINNELLRQQTVITGSATFALTSLGQAFADAGQFGQGFAQGFRAINNNIQQVAGGFAYLTVAAGGTRKALIAVREVFTGPLKWLFIFQAASAAMEGLSLAMQRNRKSAREAKTPLDELIKSASGLVTVEGALSGIEISGAQAAQAAVSLTERIRQLREDNAALSQAVTQNTQFSYLQAAQFNLNEQEIRRLEKAQEALVTVSKEFQRELFAEQILRDAGLGRIVDEVRERERLEKRYKEYVRLLNAAKEEARDLGKELAKIGLQYKPAETRIAQRMEEIRRSTTLVGRAQGAQGIGEGMAPELRQLSDETLAEMDRLQAEIEAKNRNGEVSWRASWLRRTESVAQSAQLMSQAIGTIGTSFMQIARSGEETDKKMFERGKKFAIAQAIISTYVGFTKALEQKGPMGFVTGAAVLAAGMAKVQAIRATRPGGGAGASSASSAGVGAAPTFFTGFTNTSQIPASSLGFPVVPLGQRSQQQVSFVIDGRNLVGVLENNSAAQQRMTGRSMVVGTARPSSGGGFVDLTLER